MAELLVGVARSFNCVLGGHLCCGGEEQYNWRDCGTVYNLCPAGMYLPRLRPVTQILVVYIYIVIEVFSNNKLKKLSTHMLFSMDVHYLCGLRCGDLLYQALVNL